MAVTELKNYDLKTEKGRIEWIRFRLQRMSQSKSALAGRFQLQKQIYEVFTQHLNEPEVWNKAYRFPEVFGSLQRKYADLIDIFPEVKIRATKPKSKDFTIAAQAAWDHEEDRGNARMEKARVIFDALIYGTGILFEGYGESKRKLVPLDDKKPTLEVDYSEKKKEDITVYDGLISQRIDPRNFYVDETAYILHDETDIQGASDCAVRELYNQQEWESKFKDFKNFDTVKPVAWGVSLITFGIQPYQKESEEQKTSSTYYEVVQYWNKELDWLLMVANGVEIYFGANPYKHKRLPFTVYYNYRRDDSFWGISETEVIVPFIQAKEDLNNLLIIDGKLQGQPALAVAGYAQFNEEENELQPGAIFNLRGVVNGKVSDAITPLNFGEIGDGIFKIMERIENDRITITGDDTRALYSNPGQLATQTLAKREAAQKRIKSNILLNTLDSEYWRAKLRFSNIVQFMTKPYMTASGKIQFRRINLEGYQIRQNSDESKPYFTQEYGAQGCFTLNDKTFGDGDENVEIEIVDVEEKELQRQESINNKMKLVELGLQFPDAVAGMSIIGLLKQLARDMNIDYFQVFPDLSEDDGNDPMDLMIDLLIMGITPDYAGEIDPQKVLQRLAEFTKTYVYKKLSKPVQDNFNNFLIYVTTFVPQYLKNRLQIMLGAAKANQLQGPAQIPQQLPTAGMSLPTPDVVSARTRNTSPVNVVPGTRSTQTRLGFGQSGALKTPMGNP